MNKNSSDRGIAMVMVMLTILVLSVLGMSLIFAAQTQTWTAVNYRLATQARYAAEAGVQYTMNWLANTYTPPTTFTSYDTTKNPVQDTTSHKSVVLSGMSGVSSNYPDTTVQSAYNTALNGKSLTGLSNTTFSTYATLLRMGSGSGASWVAGGTTGVPQTWQIVSNGSISGVRNSAVQIVATYESTATPISPYAVYATSPSCPSLKFTAGSGTDSYNSSLGVYSASNHSNSNGNIGSNGNITLSNSTVYGIAKFGEASVTTGSCPNDYTTSGSTVLGTTALGSAVTFPSPSYTNPSPAITTNTTYNVNTSLPPGNYGNITESGHTLTLSPGTYNFNSLSLMGGGTITVSPAGQVVIEIAGVGTLPSCIGWVAPPAQPAGCAVGFSGGSISNSSGKPDQFQIVYNGSMGVALSGGSNSYGYIYAPNAPCVLSGGGDWYGSIVVSQINDSGGSNIHYDQNLSNTIIAVSAYRAVGFSWSKF
jgi:Tfp pilus assembly protein PilX